MTVPLPDAGDGSRRLRRQQKRRRARRVAGWLAAVVAAGAVVTGLVLVVLGMLDDDPDSAPPAAGGDEPVDGPGPALLALADGTGTVYGITLFVPTADTIIHVPPGTLVEVPSLGLASLQEAAAEGGEALLRQSLENLLGARFEEMVLLGPDELGRLVGTVAPLPVLLDEPLEAREASGRVTVVIPAGTFAVGPENVLSLLEPVGEGTALDRLVRHQQFWMAYLAAGTTSAIDAVDALAGAEVRHRVLPVEAVSGVEGEELYRVDAEDLDELVRRVLPEAVRPEGGRIRVRILNGVGAPGIAQEVQPFLVDVGAEVTLSGNADRFDYATTQVVYYADEHLEDARAVAEALGVGEVVKSLSELAVVDVTVVVGADFLAAHPKTPPDPEG